MFQTLTPGQWGALLGIFFLGSFVQSAVGFAAGMICISLSLLIGIPLPESIVMSVVLSAVQSVSGLWDLRKHAVAGQWALPAGLRLAWMPLGILALNWMDRSLPLTQIKAVIGVAILLAVIVLLISRMPQRSRHHWAVTIGTFSLSGFMQGSIGIAGPPIVLWLSMLDWSTQRSRAFMFQLFLCAIPFQAIALAIAFPHRFLAASLCAVLLLPGVFLGSWMGLKVGNWLSKELLRNVSYALLALLAISFMVQPFFSHYSNTHK